MRFKFLCLILAVFAAMLSCKSNKSSPVSNSTNADESVAEKPAPKKIMPDVDSNGVYRVVEQRPVPIGGMSFFYKYIQDSLTYPKSARRKAIEGDVYIEFVVDTFGSVIDAKIMKGFHEDCDEEALRVIENSPRWEPGRNKGVAVNVRLNIPIRFRIEESKKKN